MRQRIFVPLPDIRDSNLIIKILAFLGRFIEFGEIGRILGYSALKTDVEIKLYQWPCGKQTTSEDSRVNCRKRSCP